MTVSASALIGLVLSIVVSVFIALFNGAKSMDTDLHDEREKLKVQLNEARGQHDPSEDYHLQVAAAELGKLSIDAKKVLQSLFSHERIVKGRIPLIPGIGTQEAETFLEEMSNTPLVRRSDTFEPGMGTRLCWEIVPGFKSALGQSLFTKDTLPSLSL